MALDPNINTLEKLKFFEYLGETTVRAFVVNQSAGGGSNTMPNYGLVQIPNGQSFLDITFVYEMVNTNYSVLATVQADESNPSSLDYTITNKTTTGFRAVFSARADSDNYFLNYVVMGVPVGMPSDTLTQAMGDARYYLKTQLDSGQLDNRYYTEAEINAMMIGFEVPVVTTHAINFGNENNEARLTVLDSNANDAYLYYAFSNNEELRIQGVNLSVENIINGISFDVVGFAPHGASGIYQVKVKKEVANVN